MASLTFKSPSRAGQSIGESPLNTGTQMDETRIYEETMSLLRVEARTVGKHRERLLRKLRMIQEYNSVLEMRIFASKCVAGDLEAKLKQTQHAIESIQKEKIELWQKLEDIAQQVKELNLASEQDPMARRACAAPCYAEFSYTDMQRATRGFDGSLVIARGRQGVVYKGVLYQTTVAIKVMDAGEDPSAFLREVEILSRVRHPNVVALLGACPEAAAVVYEYLPSGTLEDRLSCRNNTSPLSWQLRTRIARQVLSALIFLHGNRPRAVLHGNLKPADILLGAHCVAKISGFGGAEASPVPRGVCRWACSDISSYGVILLCLLTGRTTAGVVQEVDEAVQNRKLHRILDDSAGAWPFALARQLARLALRCCKADAGRSPELVGEMWTVLEQETSEPELELGLHPVHRIEPDPYFICPISKEIMYDPQVAADGFTYEAESIRNWLDSGHDKSPMTNIKLPHLNLLPNKALRAAIEAWFQKHQFGPP